jgi:hypothetical protein
MLKLHNKIEGKGMKQFVLALALTCSAAIVSGCAPRDDIHSPPPAPPGGHQLPGAPGGSDPVGQPQARQMQTAP